VQASRLLFLRRPRSAIESNIKVPFPAEKVDAMSFRQTVKGAVQDLYEGLGRPVNLDEIRVRLDGTEVPFLDAVCGSLVRTGDLQSSRARKWVRERRNVYAPTGVCLTVDEEATPPSRSEIVASAVHAIWTEPSRDGVPIASHELRAFLRECDPSAELVSQPTLLPTVLNGLRKPGADGPPIVESVQLPDVRAQRWIPFGADWRVPADQSNLRTKADEVVALTRQAMLLTDQLLVTYDVVDASTGSGPKPPRGSRAIAGRLSEVTRPVPSGKGGRIQRTDPHVVHLGEVNGQAVYTLPEHMIVKEDGLLPPAVAAFEWRRWQEDWEISRVAPELIQLDAARDGRLTPLRLSWVREQIDTFRSRSIQLLAQTPARALHEPSCTFARAALTTAEARFSGTPTPYNVGGTSFTEAMWLSAADAATLLIRDLQLGDTPRHVITAFLRDEVVRRRNPLYTGRTGQRSVFDCRWEYEEISLLYAGAQRWGTPEAVMLARQGMHILGPIRSFEAVATAITTTNWDVVDVAATLGMLGHPDGRPLLAALRSRGLNRMANQWVRLADAMIAWRHSPVGASPWRHRI
jgi:hypothetical protein